MSIDASVYPTVPVTYGEVRYWFDSRIEPSQEWFLLSKPSIKSLPSYLIAFYNDSDVEGGSCWVKINRVYFDEERSDAFELSEVPVAELSIDLDAENWDTSLNRVYPIHLGRLGFFIASTFKTLCGLDERESDDEDEDGGISPLRRVFMDAARDSLATTLLPFLVCAVEQSRLEFNNPALSGQDTLARVTQGRMFTELSGEFITADVLENEPVARNVTVRLPVLLVRMHPGRRQVRQNDYVQRWYGNADAANVSARLKTMTLDI